MGLASTLIRGVRPRALSPTDDFWYQPIGTGTGTRSLTGVPVSAESALKASAVWACVNLISETVGWLPLITYRRLPDEARERATNYPLYAILHDQPNARHTAKTFKSLQQAWLLLRGNAYAEILPGARGAVDQLRPLHPDRVRVELLAGGAVRYQYRELDNRERTIPDEVMWHLMGLSLDGYTGLSVVSYARETIGLALGTESYGARFFSQDARPGGVLKHPGKLSGDAQSRLKASWNQAHAGLSNAHTVAVLEEGMEWQQLSMTSEDAQFLQTRQFQVADVARWFGVPLHFIQETEKQTSWGSGIEQLSQAFITYGLMRWLATWEQGANTKLILEPERYFCEFLTAALLRGDLKTRYDAYAVGRQWGWLSANDVRRAENANPIDGDAGEMYLAPLNMAPADELRELVTRATNPPGPLPARTAAGWRGPQQPAALRAFAVQAAERVVAKERAVLAKAWARTPNDPGAWRMAVEAFYRDHADYVAAHMRVGSEAARGYCGAQAAALSSCTGLPGSGQWDEDRERLVSLALEAAGGAEQ